ncbi:MAG TPA: HEAT repeat domain-containing protein [Candidatus Hydrogenedentes bacterium]|mgnify:FL=1|jgi:hypothetical protein|nr:MAG: hypothetical protein BWY07_01354 [Candidatus Hydrogenedentes bacterium ADurb.Bin170]HNZ49745.1 HEAT repeat domain-containing protein [Candidatus Hydrogenedentota bacterium]HOD94992.1 HEAT repeat domain-containing protein [Candidatus Hydrogenedentota bacterium]HOH42108.1 HEAT repeat domain-containing protein [Candidatus Hydrogenedentota bacterium]HOR49735.1 HEAT repeat domain-containing protein [Candidatus Hydrogenedentota bacterium]
MKKYTSFIILAFAAAFILLPSLFAVADTITLKSSVQIQGKIEKEVGEFMHVRVGDRSIRVRKDEIAEVEKNDLDGSYDLEAAKTAAQEEDRKLTETLGLNEEQRDTVYRYISLLNNPDVSKSRDARAALVKMQSDLNIVPYIVFLLPSYLPPVVLSVLELITEISPDQAKEVLREYAFFTDENVRAKALEMLGVIRDKSSAELMMRGLLDHTGIVKIGACKALAMIRAQEATPLLIHFFDQSDLRIQNNVRQALSALWSDGTTTVSFNSQQEWMAFWQEKSASVQKTVVLDHLEPLVEEGTHFSGC